MNLREVLETILIDPVYRNGDCMEAIRQYAEREEKYRWHDLRKNPDDLPPIAETVAALINTNDYVAAVRYRDGWATNAPKCLYEFPEDVEVLAWREIESFMEGKK